MPRDKQGPITSRKRMITICRNMLLAHFDHLVRKIYKHRRPLINTE